jgi:spore maturation protein CgeB
MKGRRILLVSPVFHGYWKAIRAALETRGHRVETHCYDLPASPAQQLGNKLLHELPERFRPAGIEHRMTERAVSALVQAKPDVVLLVKGDQLGADWWDALAAKRLPRVTWLYDELRRMRYTAEQLRVIGPLVSYSRQDTDHLSRIGVTVQHLPLAFDDSLSIPRVQEDHVSFIGARYDGRERLLKELADAGVPVRAYGRTWSRHPVDIARTRMFSSAGVPAGRDLSRDRAYGVMRASPATLNIHGDQDGFTMRTFESSGVGAVQLVDRADVSAFYDVGKEVLVFRSSEELAELCRRAMTDRSWAAKIRSAGRRRSLAEHTFAHRVAVLEKLWG